MEHLDLATVINVSQTVSGEMVLEKLLDTLMRAAVEYAGAERSLLQRIPVKLTRSRRGGSSCDILYEKVSVRKHRRVCIE